jgi:hypothetical protein
VNVRIYSKINESEMVSIIIWFHSGAYAVGGANGLSINMSKKQHYHYHI